MRSSLTRPDGLFADQFTTRLLRDAEVGVWPASAWQQIEAAGLPLALVPEEVGGFGIRIEAALLLARLVGETAAPVPLPETLLAQRILALAGLDAPGGPLTLACTSPKSPLRIVRIQEGWHLTGQSPRVPWGRQACTIALAEDGGKYYTAIVSAGRTATTPGVNLAGEPRDTLIFDIELPVAAVAPAPADMGPAALRRWGAVLRTQQIAGGLGKVLAMTIAHAQERVQFGKPIGRFQAIQHNLALAAGETAAASAAADLAIEAATNGLDALPISAAKGRASEAAGKVAAIAQQIHGAIGITREHALHFYTTRLLSWRDEFGNEAEWYALLGKAAASAPLWPQVSSF